MISTGDPNSRALRACLQVAFLITLSMSAGALLSARSAWAALAVLPAFALTLFPVSNVILIGWILARREVRRVLSGERRLNTPTFSNCASLPEPGCATRVTVQIPVYTENFRIIRDTIEHALSAVDAYNCRVTGGANLVVSDDALMVWCDNDLPGFLAAAEARLPAERSMREQRVIERVSFYRERGIPFVARPRPVPGVAATERPGRFKKAGNLNRALRIAEAVDAYRTTTDSSYAEALRHVLDDRAFAGTHVEGVVSIGELILMLDKDSITPRDALVLTVPEFDRDPDLAYTQHKTVAVNDDENYFTDVMGVFTRLVFGLVFPAKALQGWMPPFMGHNGIVRKSVLAAAGYWAEDRVGEDLAFTMWAQAHGGRGKFMAHEDVVFGEQVTRTYAEEAGKYTRYGFSILELILNPLSAWWRRGICTEGFSTYIGSRQLGWEHKLDLMVVYPFFYINLALIPLMTVFVPYAGVNVLIYGLIFFLSLAPPLLLASQQEAPERSGLALRLFQFQALGFLFVSYGFSILKGFGSFFFGANRVGFAVTSVDGLETGRSPLQVLAEMTAQIRTAAVMLLLVGVSFGWAESRDLLTTTHLAAASPVLFSVALFPFLMSPALLASLRTPRGPSRREQQPSPPADAAEVPQASRLR